MTAAGIKFVPPGTEAPDSIAAHEAWVDVGSRAEPPVFDHHGGEAESSAALVQAHSRWLQDRTVERIVTHSAPDLDALTAIWLIRQSHSSGDRIDEHAVSRLVDLVTRHDRGDQPVVRPARDWAVLFTESLADLDDNARVSVGLEVLSRTHDHLAQGLDEDKLAEAVFPVELIQRADASESDFENDCSAAWKYPVFLQHPIGKRNVIHTADPVCTIFPRVLRWRARQRLIAADVCVVSTTVAVSGFKALLWRHIISVPRDTELTLKGLGDDLEQAERGKEDQLGGPLVPERKRLAPGKGRFGSGVVSPWYDGRGHGYTIIDTPCFSWKGKTVCGSLLTPEEVAAVLQNANHEP